MVKPIEVDERLKKLIESEGDKKIFEHMGYRCVILRHSFGHLCGYVGVDKGHILYGIDYEDLPAIFHCVHGGLTFSGKLKRINYTDEGRWYFGFDCAHSEDLCPYLDYPMVLAQTSKYRTMQYVENECKKLAEVIHNFTRFYRKIVENSEIKKFVVKIVSTFMEEVIKSDESRRG